jgi:hypothetical protein
VRLPGRNQQTYDAATGAASPAEEETAIQFSPDGDKTLYFFTWENSGAPEPPRISGF